MTGHCVEKVDCPKCGKNTLQIFENDEEYSGWCFNPACSTYYPDPYSDGRKPSVRARLKKSKEEIEEELKEIDELRSLAIPDRGLDQSTLEYFNTKVAVSEEDGVTPVAMYYPLTKNGSRSAYKTRFLGQKKFMCIGDMSNVDFFGWEQAIVSGAKNLIVTEGEDDAQALFQALKRYAKGGKYEDSNPAVVSLVSGASSARKAFTENQNKISRLFEGVILAFDNDDAGKAATEDVLKVFPLAKTADYPGKDPRDAVLQGKNKALATSILFKAQTPKNTRVVLGQTLFEVAKKPAEMGLSWPWDGVTRATKGIRFGETTYIGASPKMGKSELVNSIGAHCMVQHGLNVFMVKPEEANNKTIKMVLGKVAGKHFHDPDIEFDQEAYEHAAQVVGDKLYLLDLYQHGDWNTLKTDIRVAVDNGSKIIFIDPITNLTGGMNSAEANTKLQDIAHELASMAKDDQFHAFVFCHLRNPDSGEPHERGGKVLSSQFAGSRAMARSCNYMMGLEGNRDPDLPEETRNMRQLVILEDREFGNTERIHLYWNKETGLFQEIKVTQ